jgi:hypothetical protein
MATEDTNPQSAPIEENGESKKRKEKKAKPPGMEVKPIRKVTLNLSDGLKLRRLLTAHEAKCGENLTASNLFSFVINRMAVQILDARARTKNLFDERLISALRFGHESEKNPVNDTQSL